MEPNKNDNSHMPVQLPLKHSFSASALANYLSVENIYLPPSLNKNDPLEVLAFPVRLENALRKMGGVTTVGQFCDIQDKELLKIKNIGRKSIDYFFQVKQKIREEFGILPDIKPVENVDFPMPKQPQIPANQLIALLLSRCGNDKAKEIIKKRYGLINGERQTLEEIGESYGITRERIRQIQAKALKNMKHPISVAKKPLLELMEKILFQNGGLLSAEEADIKVPEALGGMIDDGSSVLDLLCDLELIQSCRIGDIVIYSPLFDGVKLDILSEKIIASVKKEDLGLDVLSIVKKIELFKKITDDRFDPQSFVFRYCRTDPRIEEIGLASASPETIFKHYTSGYFAKKSWVVLMKRVLEQEQMPLHFTEITNKVNDLMGNSERQVDVRRAHSIMIEDEAFAHSGVNGTYGLTAWGLRKELTPQLIEECMKKAGFPLHWKQIYNYVSKYKNTKPANITTCLETNRLFKKVDTGVYWLADNSSTAS